MPAAPAPPACPTSTPDSSAVHARPPSPQRHRLLLRSRRLPGCRWEAGRCPFPHYASTSIPCARIAPASCRAHKRATTESMKMRAVVNWKLMRSMQDADWVGSSKYRVALLSLGPLCHAEEHSQPRAFRARPTLVLQTPLRSWHSLMEPAPRARMCARRTVRARLRSGPRCVAYACRKSRTPACSHPASGGMLGTFQHCQELTGAGGAGQDAGARLPARVLAAQRLTARSPLPATVPSLIGRPTTAGRPGGRCDHHQ